MSGAFAVEEDGAEANLWIAFKRQNSQQAREKLFTRHAAFARNIAGRHYRERSRGDLEIGDLRQFAYTGLLEALDRFDPDRGIPFRAFAAHRISGSIRDGLSRMTEVREQLSWRQRVRRERTRSLSEHNADALGTNGAMEALAEIAVGLALGFILEGTGLYTEDIDGQSPQPTAYDSLAWKDMIAQLSTELSKLPDRERMILREHYGGGVGFDELASACGLTKGRISQLHRSALDLLRKRLGARGHFRLEK
jgi:RNA polymerase sigma factor for flagellar operon FliA